MGHPGVLRRPTEHLVLWVSAPDSRHSRNIAEQPTIAIPPSTLTLRLAARRRSTSKPRPHGSNPNHQNRSGHSHISRIQGVNPALASRSRPAG